MATSDSGGGFFHWLIEVLERYEHRPILRYTITLWRGLFVDIAPHLPASQIFALTSRGKFQIGVAAALVTWVICLLVPAIWSTLIGTHWGSDPGRVYFFRDWHNLFLYTLVCPGYVAAGSILIATVVSGLWGIREIENRVCCRPVEIDRVPWRLPLLVLLLLAVSMSLTSNYINDVSDVDRIRHVYWFLDRMSGGEARLNSLGVYYFLLKDVLNNSNSCVLQGRRFSDGAMDAVFPQSGLVLCGLEAFFRRFRGHLPVFRRTHPCAASN